MTVSCSIMMIVVMFGDKTIMTVKQMISKMKRKARRSGVGKRKGLG